MTTLLNYIVWNPDVYLIQVGHWGLRWYSACWLLGLLGAYFMVKWLFYHQHIAEKTVFVGGKKQVVNVFDPLFIYCFLGILIGARLGHCLFYQPDYFLSSGTSSKCSSPITKCPTDRGSLWATKGLPVMAERWD